LCCASDYIQVVGEHSSGVLIARLSKYGIESSLHTAGIPMDAPGPEAKDEHCHQEHEPENKGVLVVCKMKRVDDTLAAMGSINAIV
jgi:hypothetical protein